MKHLGDSERRLLDKLVHEAGLALPPSDQDAMLRYLDLIMEANLSLNLTRIAEASAGVRLHLVDSLLALPEVEDSPPGALLDIGTGGGFPGVPLCISGRRRGTLLDSIGKKVRAVNDALEAAVLTPGICALQGRAEELALREPGSYSVVTARAVSELPALVELSSPLLIDGGRLVALKGVPTDEEVDRGSRAALLVGMRQLSLRRAILPAGGEQRCVIVYVREGVAATRLPRRTGTAQHAPLA